MNEMDQIMNEHSHYLVRIAYLYVKNWSTAEDVVQEVFVKYFQKSDQFRNEASLKTYLTKMTANRAKDYLRSWKHKKDVVFETIFVSTKSSEEQIIEQEQLASLEKHLFQLPLKYREPLLLYYYDEQSITEIALFLGLNENTVKTRLRRAKLQLKGFFEDEEVDDFE